MEAQREEVLKYQDIVLNSLLKQLLSDSEITEALSSSLGHRSVMLNLGQIFNGYEKISETDVEAEDIEKLNNLDDAEVRALLAKVILGVDAVVLQREAVKPHGSFEIC